MFKISQIALILLSVLLIAALPAGASESYNPSPAVTSSESSGFISGIVTDQDNNAVSGASVAVEDTSGSVVVETTTTESGEYTVEVPPGEYTIAVSASGYESTEQSVSVTAGMTVSQNIVLLEAESSGFISGIVTDQDNNAISGALVSVKDTSGSVVVETTTTESGEYTVEVPPGEYTAIAESNGDVGSASATVVSDETEVANVVLIGDREPDGPTTERTLSATEATPGEAVTVTIDVALAEAGGVQITDLTDDRLAVTITDGFGGLDNVEDGQVVFNNPTGSDSQYTVTYEVAIPEDATVGTVYDFNGTVQGAAEATISGDDSITVRDPAWYHPYTGETEVVDDQGLNAAVGDYLQGELADARLNAVILSYLSGEAIQA